MKSGFTRAFGQSKYTEYSTQNIYLNDDNTFIERPAGTSDYICTLLYEGREFGLRRYDDIVYCDTKADTSYPIKVAVLSSDMNEKAVSIKKCPWVTDMCYNFFNTGRFRFRDLSAKKAVFAIVGVSSTF